MGAVPFVDRDRGCCNISARLMVLTLLVLCWGWWFWRSSEIACLLGWEMVLEGEGMWIYIY